MTAKERMKGKEKYAKTMNYEFWWIPFTVTDFTREALAHFFSASSVYKCEKDKLTPNLSTLFACYAPTYLNAPIFSVVLCLPTNGCFNLMKEKKVKWSYHSGNHRHTNKNMHKIKIVNVIKYDFPPLWWIWMAFAVCVTVNAELFHCYD